MRSDTTRQSKLCQTHQRINHSTKQNIIICWKYSLNYIDIFRGKSLKAQNCEIYHRNSKVSMPNIFTFQFFHINLFYVQ